MALAFERILDAIEKMKRSNTVMITLVFHFCQVCDSFRFSQTVYLEKSFGLQLWLWSTIDTNILHVLIKLFCQIFPSNFFLPQIPMSWVIAFSMNK